MTAASHRRGPTEPGFYKGELTSQEIANECAVSAALLTGGLDKPYVLGLATSLSSRQVRLDVVGSDDIDAPELHAAPDVNFLNLRGRSGKGRLEKASLLLSYYLRILRYAASAKPKVFHILWNNKFQFFDRTLLMLYYKALGKKIVFTAHNVNAGKRDGTDSPLNRLTLKVQYRLSDHIFVHTERMRDALISEFDVQAQKVTVIPFGINDTVPKTGLTKLEARRKLGIGSNEKTVLFFGAIRPYKGLSYLVDAFATVVQRDPACRLVIAGEPRKDAKEYTATVMRAVETHGMESKVTSRLEYIPDEETEIYFQAADVLVLPYTSVFQSGVLFLAYGFGLPVVASDVGSVGESIVEGRTGFICQPQDPGSLAAALKKYFESDLYAQLEKNRLAIREYAEARHSWATVAEMTQKVYTDLQGGH